MAKILAVDSDTDEVVQECLQYRTDTLYEQLRSEGNEVQQLPVDQATREAVLAALGATDVKLFTASGHGLPDRFNGTTETILAVGQQSSTALGGKIIHLLACDTGQELGADLVSNGCAAFFGYNIQFFFPMDRPSLFLECDAAIDIALADGGSADDAYRAAVKSFNKQIAKLKAAGQTYRASLLQHNRDALCAPSVDQKFGDPTARL
jgi:hypothetical protein